MPSRPATGSPESIAAAARSRPASSAWCSPPSAWPSSSSSGGRPHSPAGRGCRPPTVRSRPGPAPDRGSRRPAAPAARRTGGPAPGRRRDPVRGPGERRARAAARGRRPGRRRARRAGGAARGCVWTSGPMLPRRPPAVRACAGCRPGVSGPRRHARQRRAGGLQQRHRTPAATARSTRSPMIASASTGRAGPAVLVQRCPIVRIRGGQHGQVGRQLGFRRAVPGRLGHRRGLRQERPGRLRTAGARAACPTEPPVSTFRPANDARNTHLAHNSSRIVDDRVARKPQPSAAA